MISRPFIYDILYALAASQGREAQLFGNFSARAHAAFERSLYGSDFPEIWFEIPLKGEPWFDLHVLTDRKSLDGYSPAPSDTSAANVNYPEVFEWFAAQGDDVRQFALSYDLGSQGVAQPAAQLLLYRESVDTMCDFLTTAGTADAAVAYRSFIERLPKDWFACYAGVFPERPGFGVRVECIPRTYLAEAYAQDARLLEQHLRQVGITQMDDTLIARCQELARLPFQLEFQFDVALDGTTEQTLGASVRFSFPPGEETYHCFDSAGAAGELMSQLESWGLADDRWRLFEEAAFAKRVSQGDKSIRIYNYPTFIKLRWKEGVPFDAKAYFIGGLEVL